MGRRPKEPVDESISSKVTERAREISMSPEEIDRRASLRAIENATWGKEMTDQQKSALIKVARDLDLSVALGHMIYLGGNPYITFPGLLKFAHDSGKFIGFSDDEYLPGEKWDEWGIPQDATFAWLTGVNRAGCEENFIEVGWAGGDRELKQPVARSFPGEMARKRARARALQLAFPVGVASYEDVATRIQIPDELFEAGLKTIQEPKRLSETKPEAQAEPETEVIVVQETGEAEASQEEKTPAPPPRRGPGRPRKTQPPPQPAETQPEVIPPADPAIEAEGDEIIRDHIRGRLEQYGSSMGTYQALGQSLYGETDPAKMSQVQRQDILTRIARQPQASKPQPEGE